MRKLVVCLSAVPGGDPAFLLQRLPSDVITEIVPDDSDSSLAGALKGAEALVARRFSRTLANSADSLRFLQVPFTGVDGIDFTVLPKGVKVANCYGHEVALAEHTFALLLAVVKRILEADRLLREGDWSISWAGGGQPLPEVWGRTMGILGLGPIAEAIVPRAHAFGMSVMAVTRRPSQERAARLGLSWLGALEDLEEMASQIDVLVVAIALSELTRGIVNTRVIEAMRDGSFLINVARGDVVDEDALYSALLSGKLAGAGIDTWWQYPKKGERRFPSRLPFHELPNVVMTPHTGGWTTGTAQRRRQFLVENLNRYFAGLSPLNVVNEG